MQAIILAAGNSTRTYPLTVTRPKPLLKVAGQAIIEHHLEELQGLVDEAIIIVSYKKEMIRETIGNEYKGIKVTYIEQGEPLGTGHAVMQAKNAVKDKFLVLNGDDLFSRDDIKRCLKHRYCVLADKRDEVSSFGVFVLEGDFVKKIVEKPSEKISDKINTGLYVFDKSIFEITLTKSKRGEYEITEYIEKLIEMGEKVFCETVKDYWLPIGYPWDILSANSVLLNRMKEQPLTKEAKENATINGKLIAGDGTKILKGVYIEGNVLIGKNCKIGPNCYLRGDTSIGDNCHIGQAVEIKNCVIMDNSKVPHLSYIGDSVIGESVNLGAGTITANLRHDNKNIKTPVKGELVDTGRRKLGTIIGDNVHTGIHTSIYPGRKIWPDRMTAPGEVVTKDVN